MPNIEEQNDKIKYQLKMVMETIDFQQYPIQSMVLELDWNEDDLTKANDIFEEYNLKIENEEEINWTEFELKLREQFDIGYQTVKIIILAFFRNHQWVNVCTGYANHYQVSEFDEILKK